mmetsp:Transcript_32962/g.99289  ORF Transcript_32962/g.99289 Transcript_32962/m.99289 type:complete len:249 (-) Transcript_32962:94-840(-)
MTRHALRGVVVGEVEERHIKIGSRELRPEAPDGRGGRRRADGPVRDGRLDGRVRASEPRLVARGKRAAPVVAIDRVGDEARCALARGRRVSRVAVALGGHTPRRQRAAEGENLQRLRVTASEAAEDGVPEAKVGRRPVDDGRAVRRSQAERAPGVAAERLAAAGARRRVHSADIVRRKVQLKVKLLRDVRRREAVVPGPPRAVARAPTGPEAAAVCARVAVGAVRQCSRVARGPRRRARDRREGDDDD